MHQDHVLAPTETVNGLACRPTGLSGVHETRPMASATVDLGFQDGYLLE
jgi:hypothetical protein